MALTRFLRPVDYRKEIEQLCSRAYNDEKWIWKHCDLSDEGLKIEESKSSNVLEKNEEG